MAEAGKKKAGREGPRSGAAYTEGDRKRQGDDFAGLKNRSSKINGLSMWFRDTTFFEQNRRLVMPNCWPSPSRQSNQTFGRCLFVSSNGKENPSYTRKPEFGPAANPAWERLSEARENLSRWQGELPTHRAYCSFYIYQWLC
ncbi:hypothetical protein ABCW43_04145 [Neorhizobium sp. IRAMC:178]|uniref:hypothetical protein n=1 Tax=Neorhizobium tunisiense TaxID=3144793 RepID=UPI0031F6E3D3